MKLTNFFFDRMTREAPGAASPGGDPANPDPAAAPPDAPSSQAPAAADLSFIPADYVVDGKPDVSKFMDRFNALVADDAKRAEAAANVPADGVYAFDLPADFKLPDDLEVPEGFEVKAELERFKPLYDELGGILKELGAPKEAAGKLSGLLARYEAQKAIDDMKAWQADMSTLGTPEQQAARAKEVLRKLETKLPKADVEALFSGPRVSATGIKALEKLLSTQGFQDPPPPPPGADTENLSPMERLKRANAKAG